MKNTCRKDCYDNEYFLFGGELSVSFYLARIWRQFGWKEARNHIDERAFIDGQKNAKE
jgi:hypothetical protein